MVPRLPAPLTDKHSIARPSLKWNHGPKLCKILCQQVLIIFEHVLEGSCMNGMTAVIVAVHMLFAAMPWCSLAIFYLLFVCQQRSWWQTDYVARAMIWWERILHTLTFLGGELGSHQIVPFQLEFSFSLASGEGAHWRSALDKPYIYLLAFPQSSLCLVWGLL